MSNDLTDSQLLRYSRQIMLPELDIAGQQALLDATVVIIGLGGLGAPAALYLAAAGIGQLILVDDDAVELSNLQRQIIHHTQDIGSTKVQSAAGRLAELNPDVVTRPVHGRLDEAQMQSLFTDATVIVDATDNFSSRYLINRVAWRTATPLVSAAAIRWEGQISVFDPGVADSPCYQCLYPSGDDQALNCAESGVVAPLVGIIGTCQALETIKLISGAGESLVGQLLFFDSLRMDWRKLRLPKDPNCATCST
jgi:adenylyltransferase/sulfurtransferase